MLTFKILNDESTDWESVDESQRIQTLYKITLFNNNDNNIDLHE